MVDAKEANDIVNRWLAKPETLDGPQLYAALVEIGAEIDSHESDLYVKINQPVIELVSRYRFKLQVSVFQDQRDNGGQWYDIPFAYQPFWDKAKQGG